MNRPDNFTFRLNPVERQLITAVAQRLERTESDAMRYLLREKARELGVTQANGTPSFLRPEGAARATDPS